MGCKIGEIKNWDCEYCMNGFNRKRGRLEKLDESRKLHSTIYGKRELEGTTYPWMHELRERITWERTRANEIWSKCERE